LNCYLVCRFNHPDIRQLQQRKEALSVSWKLPRRWIILGALAIAGCAAKKEDGAVDKQGDGVLRDDLEPLVRRLPKLAGTTAASWTSGTLGDSRVPGPTLYWIDAVVELDEGTIAAARAIPSDEVELPDDLHDTVRSRAPEGPFVASQQLDQFFSDGAWHAKAWLAVGEPIVVLVITGE